MTISKIKRKARKPHQCVSCFRVIKQGEIYNRLFGCAESGDKPFAIKLCAECMGEMGK